MSRNYWIRLVLAVMAILLEGCSGVSAWGVWCSCGGSGRAGRAGRLPVGRRPRRTPRRPRRPCRTRGSRGAHGSAAPARHHAEPDPRVTASGEKDLFPARSAAARCQPYIPRSWTPVQDRPWLCLLKSSGLLLIGIPDASTCRSDVSLSPMCNFTAESRRSLGGDGEIRTPEGFYPQPS